MLRYLILACIAGPMAGPAAGTPPAKPPVPQQVAQIQAAPAPQPKQAAAPSWQLSPQQRAELRRQLQQFNLPRK